MHVSCLTLCIVFFVSGCGAKSDWYPDALSSPSGWARAIVAESESDKHEQSQVVIEFTRERCGGGSVSASVIDSGIQLRWVDDETLEVSAPVSLKLRPAPASKTLDHVVRCNERAVNVIVLRY